MTTDAPAPGLLADPKIFDLDFSMPLKGIQTELARLAISADMKALMLDLASFTVTVAGKVIALGRKILQVALALIRVFPHVAFGAAVVLILGQLISNIPVIGPKMSAFLTPLMLMVGIGLGALQDLMSGDLGKNVAALVDTIAALFSGQEVKVSA